MAIMHPPEIPGHIAVDPKRDGERLVYRALERGLPHDYHVFYSVAWLAKDKRRAPHDGETDFVLAHPQRGLLVLEVKGGGISLDGHGNWRSIDREGQSHPIEHPVRQAVRGKNALRDKLHSEPRWGFQGFDLGHAVAFPHCHPDALRKLPDLPPEIVLTGVDLDRMHDRIAGIQSYWRGAMHWPGEVGEDRIAVLRDLFAPEFQLRVSLNARVHESEASIASLTDQQSRVLSNMLPRNRRGRVSGAAGSGKTVLAVEQARRLSRQGFRTLLTCFNRALCDYLRTQFTDPNENPRVRTFHHFCQQTAELAGIPLAEPEDAQGKADFFRKHHHEALLAALQILPDERFDAIVVDEGQDFHGDWWGALQQCLRDPEHGPLYIFHDPLQCIHHHQSELPDVPELFHLAANLRNSREIFNLVESRYRLDACSLGPQGLGIDWVGLDDLTQRQIALEELLTRLVDVEGVPIENIVLLTGVGLQRSQIGKNARIGRFATTRTIGQRGKGELLLTTIHSFKGLEAPCVILIELEDLLEKGREEVVYVGLTRARSYMAVIGTPETVGALRNQPATGAAQSPRG